MNQKEYWDELRAIVRAVFEDAEADYDPYDILWEHIDSHSWIIYTHNATQVMALTNNPDAFSDLFGAGDLGDSWGMIVSRLAYCAMMQDVQDTQEWADALEAFEDAD